MANANELKDKLSARLEQIERFRTFKPEKVEKEIKGLDEEIREKEEERTKMKAELAEFYTFLGEPVPNEGVLIKPEEVKAKIRAVMPRFPNGTNGKELAAAIGDYRITSETISDLYWTEGQTFLMKGRNVKGEVELGAKTRYLLAQPEDAQTINEDKKIEEARLEKAKATREAKK